MKFIFAANFSTNLFVNPRKVLSSWYWYWLPGLSPTPLNATLCHRGDPLSSGHVFLLLFLSSSSPPYPLEGMLAERPFSIRLVSVGLSAVSADRYESMSLPPIPRHLLKYNLSRSPFSLGEGLSPSRYINRALLTNAHISYLPPPLKHGS